MPNLNDNKSAIVKKVKAQLEVASSDLQKKIKLSEFLVTHLPYEYHYLSSVFSQAEGITIEQYFIKLKINEIKKLLQAGKLSISEISYKCGYSSPAHLTNQFKRTTGLTPTEYKLKLRKK
jgi:AraC-like DNA-binding protein